MHVQETKKQLLSRVSLGSWITIGHPIIAEIMADTGVDWLAVDLEHSSINISKAEELIRIIDLKGVTPFVRLTSNDPGQIKRVMDAGSRGVIAPMVNSRAEAEKVVSAVLYPPLGGRSYALARAQRYGHRFQEYVNSNEERIIVVQIEHIDAVNNLEEILSVPGVDAYFVGPYDLSGSLGVPGDFKDPSFVEAMSEITRIGKEMAVPGGLHVIEPDTTSVRSAIEQGARFLACSLDFRVLDVGLRSLIDVPR